MLSRLLQRLAVEVVQEQRFCRSAWQRRQRCRGGAEQVQRQCRYGGAEVQRSRCIGSAKVIVQVIVQLPRFCRGSAEVLRFSRGGAVRAGGAEKQVVADADSKVQSRCRGVEM